MSRPVSVPRWAVYLLLFGLYLTVRGYHSRDGDQAYRLPLLLHRQDPAAFADDPFVRAFDAFNPHRGYLALLDLASRPFGLSAALFGLFAATYALTCFGVDRLARSVWPDQGPAVGFVAVVLLLLAKAGNVGTNHLFEAMLLDRQVGFALGWVALALAIGRETWRPSILIGLAAIVHPSVGLQLGGLLGATWLAWAALGLTDRRSVAVGLASLTLALLPGVAPTLVQGGRLFEGLSTEEYRLLGVELQMAQHMVPSLWRRPQWLAWGAYLVLGFLAFLANKPRTIGTDSSDARSRFAIVCVLLLTVLGLAYVGIEALGSVRLTVFQPFRMATVARGLALIAASGHVLILWRRGDPWGCGRALLLGAGLAGDWAFVVAVGVELVAMLGEQSGWTSRSLRYGRPIALLLIGLAYLSRHDTERGHLGLLIATVSAVPAVAIGRRFGGGWTRRRLAFAAMACLAVPTAALLAGVAGSDVAGLVTRCRFLAVPADDIERLAVWARENTPPDARFVTPPGPKTFRLWSGRSVAFNRAASPYHAEGLKDWAGRFRAHVGFQGPTSDLVRSYLADRHGFERRYDRLGPDGLARLADTQGASHLVASASVGPGSARLVPLRIEGRYTLYRVEPEPSAGSIARAGDGRTIP